MIHARFPPIKHLRSMQHPTHVTDYSVRCTDSYDRGGQAQNLQLVTLSNMTRKCTMFHSNLLNTTHVLANLYDLFKPHSQSRAVSEHADL